MKDEREVNKLFEENMNFAYFVLWKYYPQFAEDEDMKQEALIGLFKACETFDETKGKLTALATRCILNGIGQELRRRNKNAKISVISLQQPIKAGDDELFIEDMLEDEKDTISCTEQVLDLKEFFETLTERQKSVVIYFSEGISQKDVAEKSGISQPQVSRVLMKIREKYSKWINE